ncbi:hypothetical protein ABIB73_007150 [Bradyrhizobium sp. F1.4.3]|uniref:hypothetical protein n=1 Tax=Bradyrhizobium sp. F1.4.3 TaxID=3156356 RepID=UPI00339B635C
MMTERTTASGAIQTLSSFRWVLLSIAGLTFLLLAVSIFVFVKPRTTIRSAIDVGFVSVYGKDELVDTPELVAKRIPAVYAPAVLSEMAKKDVPAATLGALQNSTAESIGRTVALQSVTDPSAEADAKEFQQKVLDRIIEDQKWRSNFLREAGAARTVLAKQSADELAQQITDDQKAIDELKALSDEFRVSLRAQREDLASQQLQRHASQQSDPAFADDNTQLHGPRELISAQLNLLGNLTIERTELARELMAARVLHEARKSELARAQLAARSVTETRVTLAPESMATTAGSRRLGFLFIAAVASVLAAFAAAAVLHNFVVTQT